VNAQLRLGICVPPHTLAVFCRSEIGEAREEGMRAISPMHHRQKSRALFCAPIISGMPDYPENVNAARSGQRNSVLCILKCNGKGKS